jgi:hypothetical protein
VEDTSRSVKLLVTFAGGVLARDQSEAAELIDAHIKTEPPASVYDALLLPALSHAEA